MTSRVGHTADVVNVDQLPFGGFGGQEPLVLLAANLEFVRSLEFGWFCGGHGNIGEKSDIDFYLDYLDEAVPKIIERLRPMYGRMYNFDDAPPFNVRLMAMDMQVTVSNR